MRANAFTRWAEQGSRKSDSSDADGGLTLNRLRTPDGHVAGLMQKWAARSPRAAPGGRVSSVFEKHGVRMGVRRRAAAQQHQRLLLVGPQLVNNAGRNDNAVACSHRAFFVT